MTPPEEEEGGEVVFLRARTRSLFNIGNGEGKSAIYRGGRLRADEVVSRHKDSPEE